MPIRLYTYAQTLDAVPLRSIFLAGPTAKDSDDPSRQHALAFDGVALTRWRAEFLHALREVAGDWAPTDRGADRPRRDGPQRNLATVTAIVPEFSDGAFAERADARWGHTTVPAGVDVRPASWGVLAWEKRGLSAAGVVVAWMGCRDAAPLSGRNARPEIQGLLERYALGAPWPRRLVLGIAPDATARTRFWALAHEAALPVARSIEELAAATHRALLEVDDVRPHDRRPVALSLDDDPDVVIADAERAWRSHDPVDLTSLSVRDLWRRVRSALVGRPNVVAAAHAVREWARGES